jgi:hypothetical protein
MLCLVGYTINNTTTINGSTFLNGKLVVNDSTRLNNYLLFRNGFRLEDPSAGGANYIAFASPATPTTHTLTWPGANASGTLINNGSGTLSWGSAVGDTTGLMYMPGRDNGANTSAQMFLGSSSTNSTPGTKYALMKGWNNAASAYWKVSDALDGKGDHFEYTAVGKTIGLTLTGANDYVTGVWTGRLTVNGAGSGSNVATFSGSAAATTAVVTIIKGAASQSGNLTEWRNSSDTVLASVSSAGAMTAPSFTVGTGTPVLKQLSATATLNFDLSALTTEDLDITVSGAADGDVVAIGVPSGAVTTTVQYTGFVKSGGGVVTVRARTLAVGENPASGTFRASVWGY